MQVSRDANRVEWCRNLISAECGARIIDLIWQLINVLDRLAHAREEVALVARFLV